jgi:hypothetical protein
MAEDKRTAKKYEVIVYEGEEARRYPNGVIRHPKTGNIMYLPPEVGRAMHQQRRDQGRIIAGEAIKKATNSETAEEGVAKVIAKRTEIALTDNGRAGNDAARWVVNVAGFADIARRVDVDQRVTHQVRLPEFSPRYLELVEKLAQENIIDAEFEDEDEDE